MGFCYAVNRYTGRGTLSCDLCSSFRGNGAEWVRKIACPYGYCQAWATCNNCFKAGKHKEQASCAPHEIGKNHEICKTSMEAMK